MEDKVCAKHGKNVFLTKQRPRPVHTTTKKNRVWCLYLNGFLSTDFFAKVKQNQTKTKTNMKAFMLRTEP